MNNQFDQKGFHRDVGAKNSTDHFRVELLFLVLVVLVQYLFAYCKYASMRSPVSLYPKLFLFYQFLQH